MYWIFLLKRIAVMFESSWQFCFAKITVKITICMILNFYVYQVIAMLFDIPNISISVELIMHVIAIHVFPFYRGSPWCLT